VSTRPKIVALSACAAAGLLSAVLLGAAPGAGADDGTSTDTTGTTGTTTGTTIPTPPTDTTPAAPVPKPRPRPAPVPKLIAAGVTVGGTLVGGLTATEAREVVKSRFAQPLKLIVGTHASISVTPQELGAASHLTEAINLAARVKRPGFVVPLKVDVAPARVSRLVTALGKRYHRDPVDATLKLRKLVPFATRDVPGRRLKRLVSTRAIVHALKVQDREPLELPFEELKPAVTAGALDRAIVIRRGSNRLFFYDVAHKPKLIRSFKVATGRAQYPTPLGQFEVINKQLNPWWYPPTTSAWAKGEQPVPPGPGNPLGTRWMGISSPYVGIHGTPDAASVGYSASHGCIRMLIPQVEWLFTKVDVGTPVFIVAA
jgi:lipoprotein-anchoring transpeptidase ErfK/SrfK